MCVWQFDLCVTCHSFLSVSIQWWLMVIKQNPGPTLHNFENILGCCSGVPCILPLLSQNVHHDPHTQVCTQRHKSRPCGKMDAGNNRLGYRIWDSYLFLSCLSLSLPLSFPPFFPHSPSFLSSTVRKTNRTDRQTLEQVLVIGYGIWTPENFTHTSFSQLQTSKAAVPEEDPKLCIQRLHHQVQTLQCQLRDQGWVLRELQVARDEAVGLQDKLKGKVGWANPSLPPNVSRPQGASTNSLAWLTRDLKNRVT